METLLCDLIREHYMACQISRMDWDPGALMDALDDVRMERYDGYYDPEGRENLFDEVLGLLELVCKRRAATMLALKVTGHCLPLELVDMVRDHLCNDGELRAVGGESPADENLSFDGDELDDGEKRVNEEGPVGGE
jgi:hypothetical protein